MADRIALNLATIKQASLEAALAIAEQVGYAGVGLWVDEIEQARQRRVTLRDIAADLAGRGLEAAELCFVAGWMYADRPERQRALAAAKDAFRTAEFLTCGCVAACASTALGDLRTAAEDFAALCDRARPFGVRCALEFIGGAEQVNDIQTASEIVRLAGRDNGGLLLDTFHFYKGGSSLAQLREVPAEQIFLVHLSDSLDLPRSELADRHRVFPGMGVAPLPEIIGTLHQRGYQGYYSLELFNEGYWESDAFIVARDGLRALTRVGLKIED